MERQTSVSPDHSAARSRLPAEPDGIGQVTVPAVAIDPVTTPTSSCNMLSGAMQVGSTVTITTNTGATVEQVTYPTPTTWIAGLCNLPEGDTVVSVTAVSPSGQVASDTVTVAYNAGGGAVAVPGIGPFGIVATMAGLMFLASRKRTRCETK